MRQTADITGTVMLAKGYQPFGSVLNNTGNGSSNYGFTMMSIDEIVDLINRASFSQFSEAIRTFLPNASQTERSQLRKYLLEISDQPISTHDDYSRVSNAIEVLAYFVDEDIEAHLLRLLHDWHRRSPVISCLLTIERENPNALNFSRIVDVSVEILSEVPVELSDRVALEGIISFLGEFAVTQETATKALRTVLPYLDAPHLALVQDAIGVVVRLSKRLEDDTWLSQIEAFLNHKSPGIRGQAAASLTVNYPDRYNHINPLDYLKP